MNETYQFEAEDRLVVAAVEQLVRRLIYSGRLRPGQLVSIAKVLHVLVNLPNVTENVFVTVNIWQRIPRDAGGGTTSFQFMVAGDELRLDCGGSEYTEGVGSDSVTTMEWSAHPGRRTDYDDNWDSAWLQHGYCTSRRVYADNFSDCEVSVEDDDNPLLLEPDEDDCEAKEEPSPEIDLNTSSKQQA